MKKYIVILGCTLIFILSGCSKADKPIYEAYQTLYQLTGGSSYNCIQVKGMDDQILQEKVNNSLTEVFKC